MTTDEKDNDFSQFKRFDGDEEKWHKWSSKTLASAKLKGFKQAYMKDMKPCSDATYEKTSDDAVKKIYEMNDRAYQYLLMSVDGIAFGMVEIARTDDHEDGNAFLAWSNLLAFYAPKAKRDLIKLTGEFANCTYDSKTHDLEEWFIKLEILRTKIKVIDASYEKQDMEVVSHILNSLPIEYSEVVTSIEGSDNLELADVKAKLRAFYQRRMKTEAPGQLALAVYTKFKGICRTCGKQGHKSSDCQVKKTAYENKLTNKGVKCFNCNKHAGHIAKDCPEPKKERNESNTKETGMFVGCCMFDNEDEIVEITKEPKEMKVVDKKNDKNENNENEKMFVGVCEEIVTDKTKSELCISAASNENWLADTGATAHITMQDAGMINVQSVNIAVVVGDGAEVKCTKRGDITLLMGGKTLILKGVLYTAKFHQNIISIGVLIRDGYDLTVSGSTMTIKKGSNQLCLNRETNGVLYYFKGCRATYANMVLMNVETTTENQNFLSGEDKATSTKRTKRDINEVHDICGHIGEAALRDTFKSLPIDLTGTMRPCDGCAKAKAKAKSVSKVSSLKALLPGERLFVDTSGPYKRSIIGSTYWILVVDQFSGKSWSFFVKKKSFIGKIMDNLLAKLIGAKYVVKFLRCDNAGENLENLMSVCNKHGIQMEYTAPNTPMQNGTVERKFVTIRDRSCAAMISAKFNDEYQGLLWAECASTLTHITNIVSNSRNIKCPDWIWYGKQPTIYKNLVQFGRIGYVTIRTPRNKLDVKAIKCVMIGYSENHSNDTYRMFNGTTGKVIQSRDVKWAEWHGLTKPTDDLKFFHHASIGIDDLSDDDDNEQYIQKSEKNQNYNGTSNTTVALPQILEAGRKELEDTSTSATSNRNTITTTRLEREMKKLGHDTTPEFSSVRQGRSKSTTTFEINDEEDDVPKKPEATMEVHFIYSSTLASDPGEPKTYAAAMNGNEKEKWIPAIKSEINNFIKRKVWTKFPRAELRGRKPLGSRWVFKKKKESDLSIRYKGRVVVKGYVQIPGVDFTDSFAPVATDAGIRIVFAITMHKKTWTLEIIDVEASFLEGDLEEDIYLEWPEGVIEFGFEDQNVISEYCIKLNKAMYGTVQAARQWNKKLVQCLKIIGMKQSKVDPCIFYLKRDGVLVLLVCIYVDDCIVAGNQVDVDWLKSESKKHFTIKELGPIRKHLGVWYDWGVDELGSYLQSNMEDFVEGMFQDYKNLFGQYPKGAPTPGLPGTSLAKNEGNTILHSEYRSIVGKILYFVKKISPICANACRELSQHLENPGTAHWSAVERLLGFLYADKNHRLLKMRTPNEMRPMDVVDSAFAINPDTRKSTSAYLGTIGARSLVTWTSKGQNIVTTSSTEAEYVSLSDGAKDTTFTTNLLDEIYYVDLPAVIAEDNTGAIFLSKNQQVGSRTKHIDVRYHFIREKVESGHVVVVYVQTCANPSDLLSKNVTQKVHDAHADDICNGNMNCWDWNREDVKI